MPRLFAIYVCPIGHSDFLLLSLTAGRCQPWMTEGPQLLQFSDTDLWEEVSQMDVLRLTPHTGFLHSFQQESETGAVAHVAEHSPSKLEALSSIPRLKQQRACLARAKPWVQTLVPPKQLPTKPNVQYCRPGKVSFFLSCSSNLLWSRGRVGMYASYQGLPVLLVELSHVEVIQVDQ
jgi:hypothetical protein